MLKVLGGEGLGGRRLTPEVMDDPGLDPGLHREALRGLARINVLSLAARPVVREVRALAREGVRPVRVLELACGGGDTLVRVARAAHRKGIAVELTGWDLSPVALEVARERRNQAGVPSEVLTFQEADALKDPFPGGIHLVTSSLFLHHLEQGDALTLLRRMGSGTERTLLVHDLRRSRLGYRMAALAPRLLTPSPVIRVDAPRSVEGAFTLAEARTLAAEAGLSGAVLSPSWPQRFLLRWSRR